MDVRIFRTGAERLDELEPLWKSLQEHHRSVDPGSPGIPPRSADDAWPRRRVKYVEWLRHPDAFILLAEESELAIGVIATNLRAMRFYERQGFRPWVVTTLGKVPEQK